MEEIYDKEIKTLRLNHTFPFWMIPSMVSMSLACGTVNNSRDYMHIVQSTIIWYLSVHNF